MPKLTDARRRGLVVLAACAKVGRPARESNTTSLPAGTIYWQTVTWLVKEGLATTEWEVNLSSDYVYPTQKGRQLLDRLEQEAAAS